MPGDVQTATFRDTPTHSGRISQLLQHENPCQDRGFSAPGVRLELTTCGLTARTAPLNTFRDPSQSDTLRCDGDNRLATARTVVGQLSRDSRQIRDTPPSRRARRKPPKSLQAERRTDVPSGVYSDAIARTIDFVIGAIAVAYESIQ